MPTSLLSTLQPIAARAGTLALNTLIVGLGTFVVGLVLACAFVRWQKRPRETMSHEATRTLLEEEAMRNRVVLPRGVLGSESEDRLLQQPAVLGRTHRLLLGDLGHVSALLEDDAPAPLRHFYNRFPVGSILVCMGQAAAAAVAPEMDKRGIAHLGLKNCVDEEGYPILANHLRESVDFIRSHIQAEVKHKDGDSKYAPKPCCLVHCQEGKNRSACVCVAYLMVEERMPLFEAVLHVFNRRPFVLDNKSFVQQLIELADAEGLLPYA